MATEPSIVMQPSGYKANVVYSELDNTSNSDFTFARASIANRYNENSLVEEMATGVPRLDYLDGSCPSLLLEPQSTNLLRYNEQLNISTWNKIRNAVSSNLEVSPNGLTTSDGLIASADNNNHYIYQSYTTSASIPYVVSFFAKKGDKDWIWSRMQGNTPGITRTSYWDLDNGVVGATGSLILDAGIEDYGDGWFRCWQKKTGEITSNNYSFGFCTANLTPNFTGDTVTIDGYLWGAQLEQLDFASSYIKTEGSTVTRLADECNNAGTSAEFNDSEGVLYCEMYALDDDLTDRRISISDGTTSNSVVIGYSTTTNQIEVDVIDGGVSQSSMTYSVADIKVGTKIAIKYKVNDCALWVSGVERATDVSATMPSGLDELSFDDGAGANDFYGKVKDIRVYTTALSDVELTALTT
jgi:hypothetical protein